MERFLHPAPEFWISPKRRSVALLQWDGLRKKVVVLGPAIESEKCQKAAYDFSFFPRSGLRSIGANECGLRAVMFTNLVRLLSKLRNANGMKLFILVTR